jgi:hypothetical protein
VGKGDCELVGILASAGLLARSPDPLPVWLRRQGADHWAHILLVQGPLRIHISYLKEQEHARRSTTDCKVKPGGAIPLPAADGIRTRVQGELVASARFHALYIARIKVGVEDQAAALVRAHAAHPRSLAGAAVWCFERKSQFTPHSSAPGSRRNHARTPLPYSTSPSLQRPASKRRACHDQHY